MPDWISIVLLGIIEGITEFLPVSSTGHLLLAETFLPRQSDLFNIVIQTGAVLAVLPLFPERLRQFLFDWRKPATQDYLLKIFVACAITGIPGYVMDHAGLKLEEKILPVAIALLIGGVAFVLVERLIKGRTFQENITWSVAIAVGLAQLVAAVFPGTSRSGATILIALILGISRVAATEFTFLVGIPTMMAAGGLKIAKQLLKHDGAAGENWGLLLLGFAVSAVVSFIAVRWLLRYVQTHTFVAFGWYRIALAAILILFALR